MSVAPPATAPLRTLPAHHYTDPQAFARERDGLLARTWHFAGHASRLEKPGDYFTVDLNGEDLFCILGRDGVVRSFYNVCQHRAHRLLSGDGSTRVVVCPYHAWTYELTGELRSGPNLGAVEGVDRRTICLTPVRTEVFLGFVFVNLDPGAAPMDAWFPGVREEVSAYVPDLADLRPLDWVEIPEACNWKVSIENYSECYHCTLNHPAFASGVVRPETYDIQPQGHCLRHRTDCQNLTAMSYPVDMSRPHAGEYSSWFLWPMFSFQVYPGNVLNTYHWRAEAVDRVTVWRGWYTPGGRDSDVVRRLAVQDRATTVEEDIRIVEAVQRGLGSRGYVPGPLVIDPRCGVNSEHSIGVLQGWMRAAFEGGSAG